MMPTSEPAYSTSTGPEPVGVEEADALAEALVAADVGVLLEELLDELQAAIATTPQVMPSTAANRLFDVRKGSIPRR
jgi:ribosomal protein L12E/L44/L45/RPP1/RPP2